MVGVCFFVSILYSVLIRYFAGFMVWSMIFILMILLLLIGSVAALLPTTQFLKDLFSYDDLPETLKDRDYQIAISAICFVIFGIGFLLICCMKRQISICTYHTYIAIGILKAAADFVRSCCWTFFIPFYITIAQLLFLAFWISVILFLFSSNQGTISPIDGTPFAMVDWDTKNQWLIVIYIFGLLW